jgi:dTDP-4-amino-4,6-dideoxygalactose transaminase
MGVPFFDIHYNLDADARTRVLKRWAAILEHGRFVNGPEIEELEAALAEFLGVPHVVGCSNGSDALVLALRAAGVQPCDEVIVPAFTFFASAGAIARIGCTPVFADIDPDSFLLCPKSAASLVTERTKAVMPVHLYGRAADIGVLRSAVDAAAGRPIAIVEDAAQAVGTVHAEGPCGGLGETAGFSCFPTKNLGATGDAGFATTTDAARAQQMRELRQHGGGRQYYHDEVGYNFRMSCLQAASLLEHLPHLLEWNAARQEGAAHYEQLFQRQGVAEVQLPERVMGHVFHQYVVRVPRRAELQTWLNERRIGSAVYYPLPLHLQPCFASLGGKVGQLPASERAAEEVLALPIYPGTTAEQRVEVVDAVAAFFAKQPA